MLTREERINNGVAWLDENRPGWLETIDLSTLNLMLPRQCVIGQCFAEKTEAVYEKAGLMSLVRVWRTVLEEIGIDVKLDVYYGFNQTEDYDETWQELTEAWRSRILELREERAKIKAKLYIPESSPETAAVLQPV